MSRNKAFDIINIVITAFEYSILLTIILTVYSVW